MKVPLQQYVKDYKPAQDVLDLAEVSKTVDKFIQGEFTVDALGPRSSNEPAFADGEVQVDKVEPKNSVEPTNSVELVERAMPCIHFLGPLEPSETGLNEVQAAMGRRWKQVTSIMDSGAIHSVAPPTLGKGVSIQESHGSINGLQYHTADGTRLPNLGQKTLEVVTNDGLHMQQTFQMAEVTRPLSSVGEITDKGNVVVFGRRGGYVHNVATGSRLPFDRHQGVYLLKTWFLESGDGPSDSPFHRQG